MAAVLVALDFKAGRARRYWRRPLGGFETWDAELKGTDWGDNAGLDQIEAFRKGPEKKQAVPMGPA